MSPLQQALLHFPGIGPVKAEWLRKAGIGCWHDILTQPPPQPFQKSWEVLRNTATENLRALAGNDLQFFIDNLDCGDRWRLIHHYWNICHYLDIETTGLDRDAEITIISVWNGNRVKLFVKDENLEEFPDYILELPLVVTFNGSTFDLPVIRRYFNLPYFPAPHVDLRWICHRCNLDGGLKSIERQLNLRRPPDLEGVDGMEAIRLWEQWARERDRAARSRLLRYCAADTIALQHVTAAIMGRQTGDHDRFRLDRQRHWDSLQKAVPRLATLTVRHPFPDTSPPPPEPSEAPVSAAQLQQRLRQFLASKRSPNICPPTNLGEP